MLRLNNGPGPMLDLFAGMGLETAMLALDLGVFDALDEGPATPGELAERIDADETGLKTMLTFLDHAGYVTQTGDTYQLTQMTTTWLLESADQSYARYFRFWQEVLYPFWQDHAATAITDGEPSKTVYEWLDAHPDRWPIAQDAFELTAEQLGDPIAEAVTIPSDGRVLDLGGGHALYSIAICRQYPAATATVFDDEAIESLARENIREAGMSERIDFAAGDYETDEFESEYDLICVFNVVHGNDPATNQALFERLSTAVGSNGQLVILDQFADRSRASIANTGIDFLDLTYLVSLGGRTYHTDTLTAWLASAGFDLTDRVEFSDRNMTLLIAEPES